MHYGEDSDSEDCCRSPYKDCLQPRHHLSPLTAEGGATVGLEDQEEMAVGAGGRVAPIARRQQGHPLDGFEEG